MSRDFPYKSSDSLHFGSTFSTSTSLVIQVILLNIIQNSDILRSSSLFFAVLSILILYLIKMFLTYRK